MSVEKPSAPDVRERDLFVGALEQPPALRASWLDQACGADDALRQRVEELLHEQAGLDDFLEVPAGVHRKGSQRPAAFGPTGTALLEAVTEKPGDRILRYKLLQKIGEGGCGVVYMAEQEEPVRRRVAIKVIKLGMDTRSVIARFEAERQALAMMDHPNIARVLDAGATETGRPFFVMELVRGVRITDYCDQNGLTTAERLGLFIQVCHAIQHAHQKGVIHRDIKPSNILVTLHDGVPVPKVIDFGIAKATDQRLTEKTLFTEFTAFIGTPAYMSPEQAEMSGLDIDTRSDIYSLGVLLYELLTGLTPFDAETLWKSGLDECRRTIREEEPVKPSTRLTQELQLAQTRKAGRKTGGIGAGPESHSIPSSAVALPVRRPLQSEKERIQQLRGDLDWVAMKCLEKDRTRRYATANDLALDLQRFLDNEAVHARPPSNFYRLQKLVRRHRGAFAAAAAVIATLLAGAGISTWQAFRATTAEHEAWAAQQREAGLRKQAERERERAEYERTSARLNEYVADINLAQQSWTAGNLGRALQLLDKHRPQPGEPDLRGFEWRYLWQLCQGDEHTTLPTEEGTVQSLAYSPDGALLAVGLRDKFSIWNLQTESRVITIPKGAMSLAFSPDGRSLLSSSTSTVRVWDTRDWSERKSLPDNFGPLAVSSNATRLATVGRDGVRVWDTATWQELRFIADAFAPVALSADGDTLAADTRSGITLWSLKEARPAILLQDSTNLFGRLGPWFRNDRALAFSPDGRHLVAPRNSLTERGVFVISIWDTATGGESVLPDDPEHIEHTGAISAVVFSPVDSILATASYDHSIRLWDFDGRQRVTTRQGHLSEALAIAFSPDGRHLASSAKDGSVKLWSTREPSRGDLIPGRWQPVAFSRDNKTLAALNQERSLVFLNLATGEAEQQFHTGDVPDRGRSRFGPPALALTADFRWLVQSPDRGVIQITDTRTRETTTLTSPDGRVDTMALSSDGRVLITGARERPLRLWDLRAQTNTVFGTEAHRLLLSPDGRTLATFHRGDSVRLWDVSTATLRTNLEIELPLSFIAFSGAAFSPDGRLLALVTQDDAIQLWDTGTATLFGTCVGHKQGVFSAIFSPDGKTLATASDDSTIKLWNVATQQELLTIRRLGGSMREMLFAPDGSMLVGARGLITRTGGLRLYRAPLFNKTDLMPLEIRPPGPAR